MVAQALSLPFLIVLGVSPLLSVAAVAYLARASLMNLGSPGLQAYYMEAVPRADAASPAASTTACGRAHGR